MRQHIKRQIIGLLDTMQEAGDTIKIIGQQEAKRQVWQDCLQAAIAVAGVLKQNQNQSWSEEALKRLDEYQRVVEMAVQCQSASFSEFNRIDEVRKEINQIVLAIPVTYLVVFLPYKAEMWDSMASVWEACSKDERCECVVMPIPYYQHDSMTRQWEFCYDGEKFPTELSIANYQEFSLRQQQPDAAYIHNPFDDQNLVTSVHPSFYSHELKKNVGKLVYIPYFVTSGYISHTYLDLPAYEHADYLIWQSEYVKSCCKDMHYYDKILPFGSPKLDRVLRACSNGGSMPAEWQPILKGKRILMLNTSLNCFLRFGKVLLEKLRYLFEIIRDQGQVALIWRPHPLLVATMESLRPELLEEFNRLREEFLNTQTGIWDQTADITNTVALSDGYIGEAASSVINLFAAAGKPVFILNNSISAPFTAEEKRRVGLTDLVIDNHHCWFTVGGFMAQFFINSDAGKIRLMNPIAGAAKQNRAYPYMAQMGSKLYLLPERAFSPLEYDLQKGTFHPLFEGQSEVLLRSRNAVTYQHKVFFLPAADGAMLEWDSFTRTYRYHEACIRKLCGETDGKVPATLGCQTDGSSLWVTTPYQNRVLQFRMDQATYSICHIGEQDAGYSALVVEENYLWLAEIHSGDVVRWNRQNGATEVFSMPEQYRSWKSNEGVELAHLKMLDFGEWIVTIPGYANGMVKIHKITGAVTMLIADFWQEADKTVNGYLPQVDVSAGVGVKIDDATVLVQRTSDKAVAVVKVAEESYEWFCPTLSKEDFAWLTDDEDGFGQIDREAIFMKSESAIFSLADYLVNFAQDRTAAVRERQIKANETMAANLDGSCGEKIHSFIIDILKGATQ
ncbi:MAG: hypothetical protein ACRDBO_04310 [Lachnospiraceae bacterium]